MKEFRSMKITRDVREFAAKEGIADETEALNAGMKAKAAEFAASRTKSKCPFLRPTPS